MTAPFQPLLPWARLLGLLLLLTFSGGCSTRLVQMSRDNPRSRVRLETIDQDSDASNRP